MISVRSRLRIKKTAEDILTVQVSPWRRGLYTGIAAILLAGFVSGGRDVLPDGINAGLVFYSLMILVSLGVAGWNAVTVVDRRRGVIEVCRKLFGFRVSRKQFVFPDLQEFLIRKVVLFRGFRQSDQPDYARGGMLTPGRGALSPRRKELGKLYLVTRSQKPEFIEESTDVADLWALGEALSEFCGLPVRSEEI